MNAEYVNLFIEAVEGVFNEVVQTELKFTKMAKKTDSLMAKNVAVIIGITGQIRGSITLNLDESYAKQMASIMMCGMPVETFDEMAQSAIREVGNMTMGRVASLVEKKGKTIDITPPTLMSGAGMSISNQITPTLVISFSDAKNGGEIDLDIAIAEV